MGGIEVSNQILTHAGQVESTKVGIKNVKRMITQMNGVCQIEMEQDFYKIRLLFPIIDWKQTAAEIPLLLLSVFNAGIL